MTHRQPGIAIALDYPSRDAVEDLLHRLGPEPRILKVGLQLFVAEGPTLVRDLVGSGHRVFLDLKLHDIPNTVARAVESAARLGVEWLTVHTAGGSEMLRAASRAADGDVRLLGVTVLTSLGGDDLAALLGRRVDVAQEVGRRAREAVSAGLDGLVCSVWEAATLRAELGPEVFLVTPGIRLAEQENDDQARVATPGQAARSGSSMLVVGRAVTSADDPAAALARIEADLAG